MASQLQVIALEEGAPAAAAAHMSATLRLANDATTAEVAAVFTFGREDVIPHMFSALLPPPCPPSSPDADDDSSHSAGVAAAAAAVAEQTSIFRFYLERHIELDSKDHGPLAIRLVETLCGTDTATNSATRENWKRATAAAKQALVNREMLWSAVMEVAETVSPK